MGGGGGGGGNLTHNKNCQDRLGLDMLGLGHFQAHVCVLSGMFGKDLPTNIITRSEYTIIGHININFIDTYYG